jgi:hypothetical protein
MEPMLVSVQHHLEQNSKLLDKLRSLEVLHELEKFLYLMLYDLQLGLLQLQDYHVYQQVSEPIMLVMDLDLSKIIPTDLLILPSVLLHYLAILHEIKIQQMVQILSYLIFLDMQILQMDMDHYILILFDFRTLQTDFELYT